MTDADRYPQLNASSDVTYILDNFQQGSEMLRLQHRDGQVANCRKDMVFHTGNDALCIVSRPFFVGFVPCRRNGLKAFFR